MAKKASWGQPNKEYRVLFCRKMETSNIWHKRRDYCVCVRDFLLLQDSQVSQIHVGIIFNPDQNFSWDYQGNQQTHCQMHMEESENKKR